ncbi:MAG: ATP-binding protein [Micrococcaceae bacterium]
MTQEITRGIKQSVLDALQHSRIVYIQGARQVGKSTLVKQLARELDAEYISLDSKQSLKLAQEDPRSFLEQGGEGLLIIDEVQLAPELWLEMKLKVDEDNRPGQFLLTGSTYTLTSSKTPDSLAGRIVHFRLDPFSESELHDNRTKLSSILQGIESFRKAIKGYKSKLTKTQYLELATRGGYPEVVFSTKQKESQAFLVNYVQSLLSKDQESFASYKPKNQLVKALRIFAQNTGHEFLKTEFGRKMNLSNHTVAEYLEVFENLFLVTLLDAWSGNNLKRIVNKPKLVFNDSGLAASITKYNIEKYELQLDGNYSGQLFESFAINEILRQLHMLSEPFILPYHYRDTTKREIDLIIEDQAGKLFCFEFKLNSTAYGAHKTLQWFKEKNEDRFELGIVFFTGNEAQLVSSNIWLVPLSFLWD